MGNLKPGTRPCHLDIYHGACFHTIKRLSLDCFQRGRRRATKGPIILNYSSALRWRWSRIGMDKSHWDGARRRRTRCSLSAWAGEASPQALCSPHSVPKSSVSVKSTVCLCDRHLDVCWGMWEWFITNSWTIMSWVWSLCFQRAIVLPEFI